MSSVWAVASCRWCPGTDLVERERLVLVAVALTRIGRQQAVRAGAAAIDGRGPVVRHRGVVRVDRVDLLDNAGGNVVVLEVGVTCRLGAVECVLDDGDDVLAGAEAQRRVVAHPRGDSGEVALTECFLPDLRPQPGQLVEFRQPDSVDLLRRERGGGMPRDRGQVAGFTAGDLADADPVVRPGERRQFAA